MNMMLMDGVRMMRENKEYMIQPVEYKDRNGVRNRDKENGDKFFHGGNT
jgi:hypothetical protein